MKAGVRGMNVGKVSTSSSTICGVELGEADQPHVDAQGRLDCGGSEAGQTLLRVRVEAEGDRLADVETEELGHEGAIMISSARLGDAIRPSVTAIRSWE